MFDRNLLRSSMYVNIDVDGEHLIQRTSPSGFLLGWVRVDSNSCAYSSHLGLADESQFWNVLRSIV